MPLNVRKSYAFTPPGNGPVLLVSRTARRARLHAGGTFFRSVRRGQDANKLVLRVVEELVPSPQGRLVVHDTSISPALSVTSSGGITANQVQLFNLSLAWDQEIRIELQGGSPRAGLYGISWQIGGGETLLQDLGNVALNKVSTYQELASFKLLITSWPPGATIVLRPVVQLFPLTWISITDPELGTLSGWDIPPLRTLVNSTSDALITMPIRAGGDPMVIIPGADAQDTGDDAMFLTAFGPTPLAGGDGLPPSPAGLNTGPDRTLVHLNYSELDNGLLGVLNHVYEWVGDSASVGSWQRYS